MRLARFRNFLILVFSFFSQISFINSQEALSNINQIGQYQIFGPVERSNCGTNTWTQSCLYFEFDEMVDITSEMRGWKIPTIKDWENIIAIILDKRIEDVENQTYFPNASNMFSEKINYNGNFEKFRIWSNELLSQPDGSKFRLFIMIQNVGQNKNNLIVMAAPISVGDNENLQGLSDEELNPKCAIYLVRKL